MYFFNVIVSILGTLHRAIVDKQVCKHKKASTHPCSLNTLTLFMEIHPHPPTHILYKRAQYSLSLSSHTHMRMHIRKKKKKKQKRRRWVQQKTIPDFYYTYYGNREKSENAFLSEMLLQVPFPTDLMAK